MTKIETKIEKEEVGTPTTIDNGSAEHVDELKTTVKGKIVRLSLAPEDKTRVIIQLDSTFKTINQANGEEHDTNSFGVNVNNLIIQTRSLVPIIQTLEGVCMGSNVPLPLVNLALVNADITIVREFKAQGEQREYGDEHYSNDCYVTKIVAVKPHISALNETIINSQIMAIVTREVSPTKSDVANPFGI